MTKRIAIAAAIASLGLAAAGASAVAAPEAGAKPQRACFFASQVNGWRSEPTDDNVVYLEVGVRDVYRGELFSACPDLDSAVTLGVRGRGGGTSICDGRDVELVVPGALGPRTCHVTKLRKLTPEEVVALNDRRKK